MKKHAKSIIIAVVVVVLVVAGIAGVKAAQIGAMIEAGESFSPPPIGVTTVEVTQSEWDNVTAAIGSVEALQGVTIASEVPGTVRSIRFESGDTVKRGQILATLDASMERAQLASAKATRTLAKQSLERSQALIGDNAISQAAFEGAEAQNAQGIASVSALSAAIAKKTIRAPFAGRLGIKQAELGQILQPGSPIVRLQSTGAVFVDFRLPEQTLSSLEPGFAVRASSATFPDTKFEGVIEVIDNQIDRATRNIMIRARFANDQEKLKPGMFVDVKVVKPVKQQVIAIPNTSVLYAPYGDSVYIVEKTDEGLQAKQVFVRLGERRGDFVAVTSGLKAGQTVVSTGAFKLNNGAMVTVDNKVAPDKAKLAPTPENR